MDNIQKLKNIATYLWCDYLKVYNYVHIFELLLKLLPKSVHDECDHLYVNTALFSQKASLHPFALLDSILKQLLLYHLRLGHKVNSDVFFFLVNVTSLVEIPWR